MGLDMADSKVVVTVKLKNDRLKKLLKNAEDPGTLAVGILNDEEIATYGYYVHEGYDWHATRKQAAYLSGLLGYDVKKQGFKNAPVKVGSYFLHPPRPFLRATAISKEKEWANFLADEIKRLGIDNLDAAMVSLGERAAEDVQKTIDNNGVDSETFPDRSELTLKIYAAQKAVTANGRKRKIEADSGNARKKALIRSGAMRGAITYELRK